jgi:hypothetical protein
LDGDHDGEPGGDFVATFNKKGVMIDLLQHASESVRLSASAVDAILEAQSIRPR